MWDKLNNEDVRNKLIKVLSITVIIAIAILSLNVFTESRDGRRQIVDNDGGVETSLAVMLSDIKGAGSVDVMIQENSRGEVSGVIVTAEGAGNPVVRNNLANAVTAIFDISTSNVMVFEKENGGIDND